MTYECAFITEAGDKALLKNIEDILKEFGAKVTNKDDWGEKHFAYRIGQLTKGHYHIWTCAGDDIKIKELKNRLNIEDGLIRYLILKVD